MKSLEHASGSGIEIFYYNVTVKISATFVSQDVWPGPKHYLLCKMSVLDTFFEFSEHLINKTLYLQDKDDLCKMEDDSSSSYNYNFVTQIEL